MGQAGGPQFSPDRRWFWDGATWQPAFSSDGRWRWNGQAWVPAGGRPGGLSSGWLALLAVAVLLVTLVASLSIGLLLYFSRAGSPQAIAPSPASGVPASPSASPSAFTDIPCDQLEHTQVHYHAYLQILSQGSPISIPTNLGRRLECFYWLHMHTNEQGIIHVESPSDRTFTLGDFFDVWSEWGGAAELLDDGHVATLTLTGAQKLAVYIDLGDGAGATPFTGDPRGIVLRNREVITLEITPPAVTPPPSFTWPPGF